jgi:hypothetical protein
VKGRHAMKTTSFLSSMFLMLVVSLGSAASNGDVREPIDISFVVNENSIALHEPVILQFKVHNGLEKPIALTLGINRVQFFDFVLTSPEGQVLAGHDQRSQGLNTQPGKLVIAPGEEYQQELLLNRWFDFDSPGRYFLTARLSTPISVEASESGTFQGKRLEFEIKPRNISHLAKLCSDLLEQIASARGVEAAQEPALKLRYINDPVAVPYLKDALLHHYFDYYLAIEGLERIANDAAIEALLSVQNDNYGDVADLARQSLARMQGRISNPKLQDAVRRALAVKPQG